jgi:hypothetical protein
MCSGPEGARSVSFTYADSTLLTVHTGSPTQPGWSPPTPTGARHTTPPADETPDRTLSAPYTVGVVAPDTRNSPMATCGSLVSSSSVPPLFVVVYGILTCLCTMASVGNGLSDSEFFALPASALRKQGLERR